MKEYLIFASTAAILGAIFYRRKTAPKVKLPGKGEKYICVYCGSRPGNSPEYLKAAEALGKEIVKRGYSLVYGGGSVGLMGGVAKAVDQAGGRVVGIIPKDLMPRELTGGMIQPENAIVVTTMHERKTLMATYATAFVALPGGLGTLEEVFEVLTWTQLGIHRKFVGLFNVQGYYDSFANMIDTAVKENFVDKKQQDIIQVHDSATALLDGVLQNTALIPKARVTWKLPELQST